MFLKNVTKRHLWIFFLIAGMSPIVTCKAQIQPSFMQTVEGVQVWPVACVGCTWNKSFQPEVTLKQSWTVSSVVWSSDGRYLSVGSAGEGIINIYNIKNWELVTNISRWDIGGFQPLTRFIDNDTALILPRIWGKNAPIVTPTIDDNVSLEKWDIKRNRIIQKYYAHFPDENDQSFGWRRSASIARAVAVSLDSRSAAVAVAGPPSGVIIYDAANAKVMQDIQCQANNVPQALAFSPDGQVIAIGGCDSSKVSVYDTKTVKLKFQTQVDPGSYPYNAISYNQSGTLIAVGSSSGDHGTVTILRASDGSSVGVLPNSQSVPFSMSGEHATITNLQWIDSNLVLASYDAWNPDGSVARVWDATSLKLVGEIGGNQLQLVAISPDGSHLAAAIGKDVIIGVIN